MKEVGILGAFCLFYDRRVYFMAIWYILYLAIWYIFNRFGMLYREKSGNPDMVKESIHFKIFFRRILRQNESGLPDD
jgi:hypothetical protein